MNTEKQRAKLRWKKKPFPELVRLSWPIMVSLLSFSVITLVDTLFVGQLGAAPLAALGLGGPAVFTVMCLALATFSGAKVLFSQAQGAGRGELVQPLIGAFMVLALGFGVGLALVVQGVALGLPWLSVDPETGELARTYASIRGLGAPLIVLGAAIVNLRLGLGDSKSSMRAALVANFVNVPLNVLFIYSLGWGVAGAAWATVLARAVELGVLIWIQKSDGFGLRVWRASDLRAVLRTGLPVGIERVLDVTAFFLLVVLLARMSEVDVAAHQIALQVAHFSFLPLIALGESASVMTGQAVGANRDKLIYAVARIATFSGTAYAALCSTLVVLFAEPLAHMFTPDRAVRELSVQVLYVTALLQLVQAPYAVLKGLLRGTGDVRAVALVATVTAWVFTPPLTAVLGGWAGLGAVGGWAALCIEVVVGIGILLHRLATGAWLPAARRVRRDLAIVTVPERRNHDALTRQLRRAG